MFVSGVYGHSTVYHAPTQSLFVFGGYMYAINRTFISNKLYALHYPTKTWSIVPPFNTYNPAELNLVSPCSISELLLLIKLTIVFVDL